MFVFSLNATYCTRRGSDAYTVVRGVIHFHTEECDCAIGSLVAIFDLANKSLVHIAIQQFILLPGFSPPMCTLAFFH